MADQPLTFCPICSKNALQRVPSLPHTDLKEFHKPIEMFSIAMEDQAEIHQFVKATGVECSSDPNDPTYGIPIARNRSQKRKALSAAGFSEQN